jgi:hypothetical protein
MSGLGAPDMNFEYTYSAKPLGSQSAGQAPIERKAGSYRATQAALASDLGKSRRIIGKYIFELERKAICKINQGNNQYQQSTFEILGDYWPYTRGKEANPKWQDRDKEVGKRGKRGRRTCPPYFSGSKINMGQFENGVRVGRPLFPPFPLFPKTLRTWIN